MGYSPPRQAQHDPYSRCSIRIVAAIIFLFPFAGCVGLLPKSENVTHTTWHSFDEAKQTIASITPNQSRREDIERIGIDPYTNPGVTILAYPDILQRFAAGSVVSEQNLEPGIRDSLRAGKACNGFAIDQTSVLRTRVGNFWMDMLNFNRQTDVTGWRFNALIVLKDDLVVYTSYGGQPTIHAREASKNPLGPLQEAGGGVVQKVFQNAY
jgi:hypothetical protein